MTDRCPHHEPLRTGFAPRGAVPESLRQHVESCPECRPTLRLLTACRRLAEATPPPPPHLATARQLWWKAQLVRRLFGGDEEARRVVAPAWWAQLVGAALALASLLGFGVWRLATSLAEHPGRVSWRLDDVASGLAVTSAAAVAMAALAVAVLVWREG